MAFDLRIEIGGLCAFVPQEDDPANKKMHVLMPDTGRGTHHGHDRPNPETEHALRLLYDVECEHRGRQQESGILVHVPLTKRVLDLSHVKAPGPVWDSMLDVVVDLDEIAQSRVDRRFVEGDRVKHPVASRLTLASGHACGYWIGAKWNYSGVSKNWALSVVWRIQGVQGDSFTLKLTGGEAPEPRTLYPINGVLRLGVMNVPPDELPPFDPPDRGLHWGDKLPHFHKFCGLITPKDDALPPIFQAPGGLIFEGNPACRHQWPSSPSSDKVALMRTATCIVARARLQLPESSPDRGAP